MQRLKPKPTQKTAKKSQYRPDYKAVGWALRTFRLDAELTQTDLAQRLGRSQNYVSQAETGLKRLDGLQLLDWAHACGHTLADFGQAVEDRLQSPGHAQDVAEAAKGVVKKASETA